MLKKLSCILVLALLPLVSFALSAPVIYESGERRVALLEMYSSQGCSSCPRAEEWMSSLLQNKRLWRDIVPLVFHVDYWDYLGWKDPYASLANSQRQRRYRLHRHSNAVYTPGFMLAGREWRQWFQDKTLPDPEADKVGNLIVKLTGDKLSARLVHDADNRDLFFNVAVLGFEIHTPVKAGENRGRRLRQDFVVLAQRQLRAKDGIWRGSLPETDFEGRKAVAFWVSRGSDPSPLQAVGGWLPQ